MVINKVLHEARPLLEGVKIRDAVIGISLIGLELDNSNIGVTYVLREGLRAGCSIFPYGQELIGQNAWDIAQWAVSGAEDLQRGIGMAVLTAATGSLELEDADTTHHPYGLVVNETDTIGMVGYIAPVAAQLSEMAKEIFIFDEGISKCGGAHGPVVPVQEQERLLPTCDIVVLSGTTFINGSIDGLLEMCSNAREVMIMGASTPMFPEAFRGTNVTVLAGSWWNSERKADIFKAISLAGGIRQLSDYSIKKNVRRNLSS